jgi:hypothetical protein
MIGCNIIVCHFCFNGSVMVGVHNLDHMPQKGTSEHDKAALGTTKMQFVLQNHVCNWNRLVQQNYIHLPQDHILVNK